MQISKNEFIEWKSHPVTEYVFDAISQRILQYQQHLLNHLVEKEPNLTYLVGLAQAIVALNSILEMDTE